MLNECFRYLKQPQFLSYESMQEESGTELGVTEDSYENIDLQRALDTEALGDNIDDTVLK